MKTRLAAAAAALLFSSAIVAPATAATITYTLTGNFQGTLDGQGFDVFATFTGIADTDGPSTFGAPFRDLTSLTAVANGVTYTSVSTGYFYSFPNRSSGGTGFGTLTNGYFIEFSGINNFDGESDLAPTPVRFDFPANQAFVTDRGTAYINNASNLTFSASLAGVPEPATWGLMILGFGAVGGAMRRRQSIAANVRFA